MNLSEYFRQEGALTVSGLRRAIGAKSDVQVRQWLHGYAGRIPGPAYCVAIERATGGLVTRLDLRPHDGHLIWPEFAGQIADRQTSPSAAQSIPATSA